MEKSIWDLPVGEWGNITQITTKGAMRRRLLDLGFVDNARVKKVLGGGKISAYLVRGAVIAIRKDDAVGIAIS